MHNQVKGYDGAHHFLELLRLHSPNSRQEQTRPWEILLLVTLGREIMTVHVLLVSSGGLISATVVS